MAEHRYVRRKFGQSLLKDVAHVDYKNIDLLRNFTTERGKIIPRRISGLSSKQQKQITCAIKRARNMALLPFSKQ